MSWRRNSQYSFALLYGCNEPPRSLTCAGVIPLTHVSRLKWIMARFGGVPSSTARNMVCNADADVVRAKSTQTVDGFISRFKKQEYWPDRWIVRFKDTCQIAR